MPRRLALATALALSGIGAASPALADSYPSHAIRWIVPAMPGDGSDITARLIGKSVSQQLGQPIVVENRPGAGGIVGAEAVATAAPDGYTMVVGNAGSNAINAAIYTKLRYDVVDGFAPIALFCTTPNVMVVSPAVTARTVPEFVAQAKASPGTMNYASGGVGSSAHMSAELFKNVAGIALTHIPYKGTTPAITGILANDAQVMIGNLPPWLALIKSGKVRALAVTSSRRDADLPGVPAMSEYYPGFETVAWFGLLAPKGTPRAIVERMNAAVDKALGEAGIKAQLANMSCDAAAGTPDAFKKRIATEVVRWKKLAKENHITAD